MVLWKLNKFSYKQAKRSIFQLFIRNASVGLTNFEEAELTAEIKHGIERHWRRKLVECKFDPTNVDEKFYVLSMFPYPSGNLHIGHVRVYTISDTIARFYRLNGKNVIHPMGWDAFGLPAENAANQRNIAADVWTKQNIEQMKNQLINLGCSFDWDRELATCDPSYYKWTQWLFLQLFKAGLAYQKEASVNWDPVDKTVLANEQVDEKGRSWRSGAKVEKKLLSQWFIRATKFSKSMYDELDSPCLEDWRDIVHMQKHWIGECDGFKFDLNADNGSIVNVWTKTPEHFESAGFIAITKDHVLNKDRVTEGMLNFRVKNPFNGKLLPVIVADTVDYPLNCDTYLGLPSINEFDKKVAIRYEIQIPGDFDTKNAEQQRQRILSMAESLNVGGYASSSKLKDWLISRQRTWGTPIPIIHCNDCGTVPVAESDLPVVHSMNTNIDNLKTVCPKCKNPNAIRESDTMDTFVDSSWYFLRYLDPKNDTEIYDHRKLARFMPVDLYIGGKEHALLHLYFARFVNHFLHSIGLVPQPEPFKRLLVQGMVKGVSYRVKSTGQYLKRSEVKIDEKEKIAEELSTGEPVKMRWDKMSKSKFNGVDPADAIAEYSADSIRLIILDGVEPKTERNWSTETFSGILNWQGRIWLTVHHFNKIRSDDTIRKVDTNEQFFLDNEAKLMESRNLLVSSTTFHYKYSHKFNAAITKMQKLTKLIRRTPEEIVKYGSQYERTLAALIVMIAPMAPHFASELWSQFIRVPNRINNGSNEINWDSDVLEQSWPKIDANHALILNIQLNKTLIDVLKFTEEEFTKIDLKLALQYAFELPKVKERIGHKKIELSNFVYYPNCFGTLDLFTADNIGKKEKEALKK